MFFSRSKKTPSSDPLLESRLFDEKTFYAQFVQDIENCRSEIIIESPYITSERTSQFIPIFQRLIERNVEIYVLTRDPREHEVNLEFQAEQEIIKFENIGVHTFICKGKDHRKLAILDRKVLWEGSLNILSQTRSREIMRRIDSQKTAIQMFDFLNLGKFIQNH